MMMMVRAINDLHLEGPHQLFYDVEILFKAIYTSPWPVVYLGDNFDLKNTRKKYVPRALSHLARARDLILARKDGSLFLNGNHELELVLGQNWADIPTSKEGLAHFTHGHIPQWGAKGAAEWIASHKAGAGWFKRNILVRGVDAMRHLIDPEIPPQFFDYMDALPEEVHTVVTGHKHPKEHMIGEHNGRKFMVLKRGINDIKV